GDLLVVVGPGGRVTQGGERGEEEGPFELLVPWVESVVMDGGWSQGDVGGTSLRRLSCFLPGARMVGRGLTGSDAGFWAEVRAD
ncbi:hypothetical protein, partial [Streptomyces sp. NPDC088748]|uniref:hypothetical protein n=1 Tax=Streptomyces sp. NPDC088748 TaxID=3365887 RepID=UPI003806CE2D